MNTEFMARCPALAGYARFVELVRAYNGDGGLRRAVSAAVDTCIEEDRLADYSRSRRSEVESMIVFGHTEEEALELMRKATLEEGLRLGRDEGMLESACKAIRSGLTDVDGAREVFGVTHDDLTKALEDGVAPL